MKAKSFLTIIVLLMVSWAASAQGYAIRLTYNTNLRAANSLTSAIVATAPAGSILQVLGQQGSWLQIDRNGSQVWMAGWVSYSRVQSVQPAALAPQTPIDNCCFVDRQCHSDQEWTDGYWAFQNGQCAAPAQTQHQVQPQTSAQPWNPSRPQTWTSTQQQIWTPTHGRGELPGVVNNCCYVDRECHSEDEWTAGWLAFKELECWDAYHKMARTPDPASMPASGSDNCCTAPGWLCLNDEHFQAGYWAFISYSHCNPRIMPGFLPTTAYYDATDNCCHLGRECHTAADWQEGYSDFLHFRCEFKVPLIDAVPVALTGSPAFAVHYRTAFSLLKARSPYYYDYAVRGLDRIVQISQFGERGGPDYVFCDGERRYHSGVTDNLGGNWANWWGTIVQTVSRITHEACHCNRKAAGLDRDLEGRILFGYLAATEVPCIEQQHLVIIQIDPTDSTGGGAAYASKMPYYVKEAPWIEAYMERPLSYYQHYLAP